MNLHKQNLLENNFKIFLIRAHQNTYAGDGKKVTSSRLNSDDFEYSENNLTYHDTYFGDYSFMGEEVIYERETPIWGMNYYGSDLTNGLKTKIIFTFLKKALSQPSMQIIPVRGPKEFKEGSYTYLNTCEGSLDNFNGIEEIKDGDSLIYQCRFHGGIIFGKEIK